MSSYGGHQTEPGQSLAKSLDPQGRYCGMKEDGTPAETSPDKVGYCGPECQHCVGFEVYGLQNGVWVCAADYDYEQTEAGA